MQLERVYAASKKRKEKRAINSCLTENKYLHCQQQPNPVERQKGQSSLLEFYQ
jgi:hypothetical protein